MNRAVFFDAIRNAPFPGSISPAQFGGVTALLDAAPPGLPTKHLAYCLATTFWETAHTMRPIEEYGRGKGRPYGVADPVTGKTYYGRGFVQLTWKSNYDKAGKILLADLVKKPELALDPDIAALILYQGMKDGWFTGRKLSDYFSASITDPVGARRIINGTDHAAEIAAIYSKFLAAIQAALAADPVVAAVVKKPQVEIPTQVVVKPVSIWDKLAAAFSTMSKGS